MKRRKPTFMGGRHPNFKGGSITDPRGYKLIYVGKGHHLADVRGYAYEHRIVAEKKIGRKLKNGEVIHHTDGDRSNNKPENINVFKSNAEHLNHHRKVGSQRQLYNETNPKIKCACGCGTSFRKYDNMHRPRKFVPGHQRIGTAKWLKGITVECACGCGGRFNKYDKYSRERKFLPSHNSTWKNGR